MFCGGDPRIDSQVAREGACVSAPPADATPFPPQDPSCTCTEIPDIFRSDPLPRTEQLPSALPGSTALHAFGATPVSAEEREAAHQVAWGMVARAGEDGDYEHASSQLGMAGQIFTRFGFVHEAEACQRQLIRRAEEAGRHEDAAFQRAVVALREKKLPEVEAQLAKIPEGYAGREVLVDFVGRVHAAEKMGQTFAVAAALVEANLVNMESAENGFWNRLLGQDLSPEKRALAGLLVSWQERVESGRFRSTREILQDIWENGDEPSRAAIAMLGGHANAMSGDEEVKAMLAGPLEGAWGDAAERHFTLCEVVGQEERPDPVALAQRLDYLLANSSGPEGNEVAAAAQVYRQFPGYASQDARLSVLSKGGENVLVGGTEALAVMITGAAAAELTTAAIMARLAPTGVAGMSLAARVGVGATEVMVNAGAFALYDRLLTQAILNRRVDWSARAIGRDWAAMALTFGFARAAQVPLVRLRQGMGRVAFLADGAGRMEVVAGRTLPMLGRAGRTTFGVLSNVTETAAFYTGGKVSSAMDLRDTPPHFFQEWLSLMQFKAAHGLANHASGGWVTQKAYQLRTKPIIEASQRIAQAIEKHCAEKGEAWSPADREAVTEAIFLAHARGEVSSGQLASMDKAFGKGAPDAAGEVVAVNETLAAAGINFVYDGRTFRPATPEAREAYVAQVKAGQRAADPMRTLRPEPAYAMEDLSTGSTGTSTGGTTSSSGSSSTSSTSAPPTVLPRPAQTPVGRPNAAPERVAFELERAGVPLDHPAVSPLNLRQRLTLAVLAERNSGVAKGLADQVSNGRMNQKEFTKLIDDLGTLSEYGFEVKTFFEKSEFNARGPLLSPVDQVVRGGLVEVAHLAAEVRTAAKKGFAVRGDSRPIDSKAREEFRKLADGDMGTRDRPPAGGVLRRIYDWAALNFGRELTPELFQKILNNYLRTAEFDGIFEPASTADRRPGWIEEVKTSMGGIIFGKGNNLEKSLTTQLQVLKQLAYAKAHGFAGVKVTAYSSGGVASSWLRWTEEAARTLGVGLRVETVNRAVDARDVKIDTMPATPPSVVSVDPRPLELRPDRAFERLQLPATEVTAALSQVEAQCAGIAAELKPGLKPVQKQALDQHLGWIRDLAFEMARSQGGDQKSEVDFNLLCELDDLRLGLEKTRADTDYSPRAFDTVLKGLKAIHDRAQGGYNNLNLN